MVVRQWTKEEDEVIKGSAKSKCCLCSYDKHVDLHHIDGNRDNDNEDNIASLCPNHHREVEAGEHDGVKLSCIWWRVYSDGTTSDVIQTQTEAGVKLDIIP